MRRIIFTIGILLLLAAPAVHAQTATLYETLRKMTEYQLSEHQVELDVQRFLPKYIDGDPFDITEDMIDPAMQGASFVPCKNQENVDPAECDALAGRLQQIAKETARVRSLARDLQLIASSYEVTADGSTGRQNTSTVRLPSIIHIWLSGADQMTNPVPLTSIRGRDLPDSAVMDPLFNALKSDLESLIETADDKESKQKLVSAVHRYRHGFVDVLAEGTCFTSGDGSELELLTMRWCNLEITLGEILAEIQNDIIANPFDPPLDWNELVVYPLHELADVGIIVWMREDDVGLAWKHPMEPVLPTLLTQSDDVVLGGDYPDPPGEPASDEGICSHPFGKRGYLCRELDSDACPDPPSAPSGNTIELTKCEPQDFLSWVDQTESGPNICGVGGWRANNDEKKKNAFDFGCANCRPDFECSPTCVEGGRDPATGKIAVCPSTDYKLAARYDMLRRLVVLQQLCNAGEDEIFPYDDAAECCATERPGAVVACTAMAQDDLIAMSGEDGIHIETCATAIANQVCDPFATGSLPACSAEPTDPSVLAELDGIAGSHTGDPSDPHDPDGCAWLTGTGTIRAQQILNSLPLPCSPECLARYENSIGNNLCYLGQCIEYSFENHRMVPGRLPTTAADEAFPWDACSADYPPIVDVTDGEGNPTGDTIALGSLTPVPPLKTSQFPPYAPRFLVEELDRHICQRTGNPALTPPIHCSVSFSRRLLSQLDSPLSTALGILGEADTEARSALESEVSLRNIGVRLATRMYADYLRSAVATFDDLLVLTTTTLDEMGTTEFPDSMCPRYMEDACSAI